MTARTRKAANTEIQDIMETWARYRIGRAGGGIGWPNKVMLGKWRDGLPSNLCPICIGREKPHHNCPVCGGDGRVKLEAQDNKANPAFITGNGMAVNYDDDPISQKVDWLVCTALTQDQKEVVMLTYTTNGTQAQKARRMTAPVSQQYFSVLLGEAHDLIMFRLSTD